MRRMKLPSSRRCETQVDIEPGHNAPLRKYDEYQTLSHGWSLDPACTSLALLG
jgi:hypothetical protein